MTVTILSPDKELFNGEATKIKVPGTSGQFEILRNHAPIVSSLGKGSVHVSSSTEEKVIEIDRGFVEVLNNEVSILVEEAIAE